MTVLPQIKKATDGRRRRRRRMGGGAIRYCHLMSTLFPTDCCRADFLSPIAAANDGDATAGPNMWAERKRMAWPWKHMASTV